MKIKVYIKRPDEKVGHSTWISNTLENLQKTVEGYIETVTFGDYVVICNEEGRLRKMPYCCTIHGVDFVGTIIVAGIDGEEFGDCPLSFDEYKRLVSRERQLF